MKHKKPTPKQSPAPEAPPPEEEARVKEPQRHVIERPDGFYWQSVDSGEEYGPFTTHAEAEADMLTGGDASLEAPAHRARHLVAGRAGHADVQDRDLRAEAVAELQRGAAIVAYPHVVAIERKHALERIGGVLVVVGDQDPQPRRGQRGGVARLL